MRSNSEINEVHTSLLDANANYGRVGAYLRERNPHRRRSYWGYLDGNCERAVYKLKDSAQSVTFQSECLLPEDDEGRPRVLLLFSNAHPESIKNGMFHTAEGGSLTDRSVRGENLLWGACNSRESWKTQTSLPQWRLRRSVYPGPCLLLDLSDLSSRPTGWRYHKDTSGLRQASLERIANAIQSHISRR
jgi:hypothetical protein